MSASSLRIFESAEFLADRGYASSDRAATAIYLTGSRVVAALGLILKHLEEERNEKAARAAEVEYDVQPNSITLDGIELENAVRREVGMPLEWELTQYHALILRLSELNIRVHIETGPRGCVATCIAGPLQSLESSENYGYIALARAALAIVREIRVHG